MNVLFIGPYRQDDEWGRKSRAVLRALQRGDNQVTSRPIFLSTNIPHNEYAEKSEFLTAESYDVLIQFMLQPYVVYDGRVSKRIGIFNSETIPYEIARGHLTKELLMDEIWTDSSSIEKKLQNVINRYDSKIVVRSMPPTLDITHLPEKPSFSLRSSDSELQHRFIFYYIGNLLEEKDGFRETFLAYMRAFTKRDPVALVVSSETSVDQKNLDQLVEVCRSQLGAFRNPNDQPLFKLMNPSRGRLITEERVVLHHDGDCMVAPGYSLSTNSLVLEAATYKSMPIVNVGNSCYEWWGEENLWGVESSEELCLISQRPVPYRFTAGESWFKPNVKSLSSLMKEAYTNKFKRDKKISANSKLRNHFNTMELNLKSIPSRNP